VVGAESVWAVVVAVVAAPVSVWPEEVVEVVVVVPALDPV